MKRASQFPPPIVLVYTKIGRSGETSALFIGLYSNGIHVAFFIELSALPLSFVMDTTSYYIIAQHEKHVLSSFIGIITIDVIAIHISK